MLDVLLVLAVTSVLDVLLVLSSGNHLCVGCFVGTECWQSPVCWMFCWY